MMHEEDARLEYNIAMCSAALRRLNFSVIVNDLNSGDNSPAIRVPMAYAMFKALVEDIGEDPEKWGEFLRDALEEVIARYSP